MPVALLVNIARQVQSLRSHQITHLLTYAPMDFDVDIAFDCLPLRSVGRVDVPLDASPGFRARCEQLQQAIGSHGTRNAYFLYNTRCVYRLANSEIENVLRFSFDGTVLTDCSDCRAERADLTIELAAETCSGMPAEVLAWFQGVVERAVIIEFNRFIAAGSLAARVSELGEVESLQEVRDFSGMHV
jgi:hypothetical protein